MKKKLSRELKEEVIVNSSNETVIELPTPSSITYFWNFGSLLGICLLMQIFSGLFLAMHYAPHTLLAYESVIQICRDSGFGWTMRTLHSNVASLFFVCLFLHVGRGIYFESYKMVKTWFVGIAILFCVMATAFLGYVLPWGQMSFWGATVITNLLSVVPYFGVHLVEWLWGGFSINNATLNRFFVFHTVVPFIIFELAILHLIYLHESKSSNPLGAPSTLDMLSFHPYFSWKDIVGFLIFFGLVIFIVAFEPYMMGDPDNFIPANSMVTPAHIKPEWYFLFAYAILRSIPNKVGGVFALVASIMILVLLPYNTEWTKKGKPKSPSKKKLFWVFVCSFYALTWIGGSPVENPFVITGQVVSVIYFLYFIKPINLYKKWFDPSPFKNPLVIGKTPKPLHTKMDI